jgi:hypothetical protein
MFQIDKTNKGNIAQSSNVSSSTSTGLVSPKCVSRPTTKSIKKTKKTRLRQRRRGTLEVQEVEAHLRNLNKTYVASDLDSNLENCNQNLNVTNAEPFNVNASCVFCRQSVLSGDHTKCVANNLSHRHKKRRSGIPSKPSYAFKPTLGKPPTTVSNDVVVTPTAEINNSRNKPKAIEFTKNKAKTSWNWQRWLQYKPNFKWIPKLLHPCTSNQQEPTISSGSTLTSVPSLSSPCDAGGSDRSLDY